MEITQYTTELPLFEGIKKDEISSVLGCVGAYKKTFKKDNIIMAQDDNACLVTVLSGTIHMTMCDINGNHTLISVLYKGDFFGENSLCSNKFSDSISFYSETDCEVLFLPFAKVLNYCSAACEFHHRLIENAVKLMASKNIELVQKLEIISKKTLREKILTYLSIIANNSGSYFKTDMNRSDLADYLCADRSALSRELSKMKQDGLIDFDKNTFRLLKKNIN